MLSQLRAVQLLKLLGVSAGAPTTGGANAMGTPGIPAWGGYGGPGGYPPPPPIPELPGSPPGPFMRTGVRVCVAKNKPTRVSRAFGFGFGASPRTLPISWPPPRARAASRPTPNAARHKNLRAVARTPPRSRASDPRARARVVTEGTIRSSRLFRARARRGRRGRERVEGETREKTPVAIDRRTARTRRAVRRRRGLTRAIGLASY